MVRAAGCVWGLAAIVLAACPQPAELGLSDASGLARDAESIAVADASLAQDASGTSRDDAATSAPDAASSLPDAAALSPDAALSASDAASPADAGAAAERLWGVTVTDPWNTAAVVDSLGALPTRATARVVFDEGQAAAGYVPLVRAIAAKADVLGEILDSQYVRPLTVQQYLDRTDEYLGALENEVAVWEVGNEINGEWLGTSADVAAKMAGAYDQVKAKGRKAALTLYYNQDCWSRADHEMFTWTDANVPQRMKDGLDLVLVSYYEDDCNGLQPDWPAVFSALATRFPNSKLGIGECGTTTAAAKEAMLRRYYGMTLAEPRFVGGFFWWYFNEDMVPKTKPLWAVLAELMKGP